MFTIGGIEYHLFKDYDTRDGKFRHLSFMGKVTYLEERVKKILLEPCHKGMQGELRDHLALILVTGVCAGISAASTYYKGKDSRSDNKIFFVDFVNRFMGPVLQTTGPKGMPWSEWIYRDLRCGLAHNFTVMFGGIEYSASPYVQLMAHGPQINPERFLQDFDNAWTSYLLIVRQGGCDSDEGKKFQSRFDKVFLS